MLFRYQKVSLLNEKDVRMIDRIPMFGFGNLAHVGFALDMENPEVLVRVKTRIPMPSQTFAGTMFTGQEKSFVDMAEGSSSKALKNLENKLENLRNE